MAHVLSGNHYSTIFERHQWIIFPVFQHFLVTTRFAFTAGPRNCIGQRFALMEEKLIIATIARNFDIISDTPMDKLQIYGQLVLRPHEKFHIKFSKRV